MTTDQARKIRKRYSSYSDSETDWESISQKDFRLTLAQTDSHLIMCVSDIFSLIGHNVNVLARINDVQQEGLLLPLLFHMALKLLARGIRKHLHVRVLKCETLKAL